MGIIIINDGNVATNFDDALALIMQTTGWFNDEVNFCCNIIDQNPKICDGDGDDDDEEDREIEDDDCDDDDDDDDAKWALF